MRQVAFLKILAFLSFAFCSNFLFSQNGGLALLPLPDAANGLHRMGVLWSGYGPSVAPEGIKVTVSLSSNYLVYLDNDAINGQTFGIPPTSFINGNAAISAGATFSYNVFTPGTSINPGGTSVILFTINYAVTPDCESPIDTFGICAFGFDHDLLFPSGSPGGGYDIVPLELKFPGRKVRFDCNYIAGGIYSPEDDEECEKSVNAGVPGVNINAAFRTLGIVPQDVIVGFNDYYPADGVEDKTYSTGQYIIPSLPNGVHMRTHPSKKDKANCGITTRDLYWMDQYVNFLSPSTQAAILAEFDKPWKLIAGDINRDGVMDNTDIALASSIMSSSIDGPWAFIPVSTYVTFAAPNGTFSGYSFNEYYPYYPLATNQIYQDFYGIKLGDIDGTCTACEGEKKFSGSILTENRAPVSIATVQLNDQEMRAGEEVLLPIGLDNSEPMSVMAWDINFDPQQFDFLGIREGDLSNVGENTFTTSVEHPGRVRFLWTNAGMEEPGLEKSKPMFSVVLRARTSLSSLQYGVSITAWDDDNFSYGQSGTKYKPLIKWSGSGGSVSTCVVSPVPFKQSFQIAFHAAEPGPVLIRIMSTAGQIVHEQHYTLDAGDQVLQVRNTTDWPAGIYMYEVQQGSTHYSGRVVKN